MGFKGSLDSINLADIFQNLATNHQSGVLRVADRDRAKSIYFQHGEIRYLAHGGRKNILLGEMLTGRGIATHEQVDAALAEQKSSGRLVGEIIIDLGICSRQEIDDLVRFQIEEEIYDLFGWEHAEFEFTEGPPPEGLFDPEQQATELAIDTSRLIMEAARRIDDWERIRQVIPSMEEVFVATTSPEVLPEGSSPVAARILTYLDGTRTMEVVVEDSHFSRFEVASNLVAMLDAGQARAATVEELDQGASFCLQQGRPARAVGLMERALAMGADDQALRYQLGEACVSLGDNQKAAIHLNVLGDTKQIQGDLNGAAAAYKRITDILPSSVAAHEKLARLRTRQGDSERALKHYADLVQALMEGGRLDDAAAHCREGLKIDQESTDLRSALAKVLLSSGDKEGAIDEFGRLAEILARAGQARPAGEVFRRILQLDPRNRYAKRRLNEVIAGKGVKRGPSRVLRYALIGIVLLPLGIGVYFMTHEKAVRVKYDEAKKRSEELKAEERFDEARAIWHEFEKEWSFSLTPEVLAQEEIASLETAESVGRKRRDEARRRAEEAAKRIYDEARALEKACEADACRAKIEQLLASGGRGHEKVLFVSPALKDAAEKLLRRVEKWERDVAEYLEWRRKAVTRTDIRTLEDERRRTLSIHSRYPGHPKLKHLSLSFRLETDPPGAEVWVDGVLRGTTPLVQHYPLGKTPAVRVKMRGYATEEDIDVRDRVRVELKLRRAVAWRFRSGAAVLSLTKGPEGTVLVANRDGVLTGLDPARTGSDPEARGAVWTFRTGERFIGIGSGVTVSGETMYFGTDRLYAVASGDRRRRWVVSLTKGKFAGSKGRVPAPPAVGVVQLLNNQEFLFGTYDDAREGGTVWAVNGLTGKRLWSVQPSETRAGTRCAPLIIRFPHLDNERLYVPFTDGRVYELDVVKGETRNKWSAGAPSSFISSLVLEGGLGWLVSGDGRLYGLDLASPGKPARVFEAGRAIATDLTVARGVAYFGDERGSLHAVRLGRHVETRTPLTRAWPAFAGEGKVTTRPVVSDGRVYFGTSEGWVYAVDLERGALVWKHRVGEEVAVSCVYLAGRYLLAGARDGIVYAYDEEAVK